MKGSTRSTKVPYLTTEIEIVSEVTCAGRIGVIDVIFVMTGRGVTTAIGHGASVFAWSRNGGIQTINAQTMKEKWSAESEQCTSVRRRRRQRQGLRRFRRRRGDRCRRQRDDLDLVLWCNKLGGRLRPPLLHLMGRVRRGGRHPARSSSR